MTAPQPAPKREPRFRPGSQMSEREWQRWINEVKARWPKGGRR